MKIQSNRARRQGNIVLLVCGVLVAIMGFAAISLDYGLLVMDTNRMQRSADAAALAGARLLVQSGTTASNIATDTDKARTQAKTVSQLNGAPITDANVTFPTFNKIRVTPAYVRSFMFAPVIGTSSSGVERSAVAGRMPIKGITHAVPLAISTDDYYSYKDGAVKQYTVIRNQDTDFKAGTLASLDLRPDNSGKSGNVFEQDLTYGYNGQVYMDQKIDNALTADMSSVSGKVRSALDARFAAAAAAPYYDTGTNYTYPSYPANDPRVVYLVVAFPNPAANNNPTLNAQFFAPAYIMSYQANNGNGGGAKITLRPTRNSSDLSEQLEGF